MMTSYYNNGPAQPQEGVVYQVEFNAVATGKIIAMSKRRIRWRYGFPNPDALSSGASGTDCRGEEHDVTLVWSVTSGKRMIMSNGKQLYVGIHKSSIFEHTWTDLRGNFIRMVAHATQSSTAGGHGTRQYDLFINGISFFTLPKVYEVGLKGTKDTRIPGVVVDSAANSAPSRHLSEYSPSGKHLVVPKSEMEEMDDLKKAIAASLEESRNHLASRGKLEDESNAPSSVKTPQTPLEAQPPQDEVLIDFFSNPIPNNTHPVENQNALVLLDAAPMQYQVDPFSYDNGTVNNSANANDEFAPKAPTYHDISDQILMNYSAPQQNEISLSSDAPSHKQSNTQQMNPFDDTTPSNNQYGVYTESSVNGHAYNAAPSGFQNQQQQMPYQQQYGSQYGYNN
mmetsp:Transcript_12259/g.14259  ORF Transcript_12259/g.14259 Transcript_12259/m.14259 type:complete len:396 (-) Transcript_12259:371-1558(-)